jgi:outer membrane protein assembly factor BamB
MSRLLACLLFVLSTALAAAGAGQSREARPEDERHEWSMARGNPGLTGASNDASVKPPLRRRWAYQTPAAMFKAEPCVAAGKVFVCSCEGAIMALDAETGRPAWMRLGLADRGSRYSTLCCDGIRLFVAMRYKGICALDAATGKTLWTHALKSPKPAPLPPMTVSAEGKLFFTRLDESGVFAVALKPEDGTEVWATRLGEAGWNLRRELCYADGTVYASASVGPPDSYRGRKATAGCVVALKAEDGSVIWKRDDLPGGGAEHGKLLTCVSDGRIVCCAAPYRHQAQVLDAKTGKTLWTTKRGMHASWFAIAGDLVLAGCTGIGAGYAFYDAKSGRHLGRSRIPTGASNCSLPAVSGGYAFSNMGTPKMPGSIRAYGRYPVSSLGAVDLGTRKMVWSYRLAGNACASPVIAHGRVYTCGPGGWVYCFEPAADTGPPPLAPDFDIAGMRTTHKKMGIPPTPGRGATFKGRDKPAGGRSWPMYGGCPQRCGLELRIRTPIELAWTFDTGDAVHSTAAIQDGLAFVGSDSGKLFALELASGRKKWEFQAAGKVHCSPAVAGGLVIVGSDDGRLYALDAGSGRKRWEFKTADRVRAAPAIVDDKVVFAGWDRCVYALNLADGKLLWRFVTSHEINAAPAVCKGRVFAGGADWILYALDLDSGTLDWHRLLRGPTRGVAVYRDMVAILYLKGSDGAMAYLCPENGQPAMKQVGGGWRCGAAFGAPAFSGDWLFFGRWVGGGVGAVDLREEKPYGRRFQAAGSGCLEAPLVTRDVMILATIRGTVEAYGIHDGRTPPTKLWEWKTPSGKMFHTSPAAAGGYVVVGNDDGHVYGFRYAEPQ